MNSYYNANVWDKTDTHIPGTLSNGSGKFEHEDVENMPVIEVTNAHYRNVHIAHDFFVISPFEIPAQFGVARKIVVLCRWFDRRLKATGLRLLVDPGTTKFHPAYTGKAVTDIHN